MKQYELFKQTSVNVSRLITHTYSTSFSAATHLFDKETRRAIYSIYGFVRFADEIVDTFHDHNKHYLLQKFKEDWYDTFKNKISLNPVLFSFYNTVQKYSIPDELIDAFLLSMEADLEQIDFKEKIQMDHYVYGSADVVGLMCLKVFCNGNEILYNELCVPAKKLGSAFQKVNFLRDIEYDMNKLGRKYFPEFQKNEFSAKDKNKIIESIDEDFKNAYTGIRRLPKNARTAVMVAYSYYKSLLNKIRKTPADKILVSRIRISNFRKLYLLIITWLKVKLNLL
ncbi:MAG: squalene/phytoene synthase family protein [Bacteroidales bacterium]|nr:squalene/phytoene synthase family protein [Bacteroidales bacterium]